MAIEWINEIETSREGTDTLSAGSTAVLRWAVFGTDDIAEMRAAIWARVPPTVADGINRELEFRNLERKQLGLRYWEWTANYSDPELKEEKTLDAGDFEWTADTTGGTQTIYVSRGTTKYAPPGKTARDFKGAIGCKTDRDIEGCPIIVPACKITAHYRLPSGRTNLAIVREFYKITGTVCDDDFLDFEPGEPLFIGAALKVSKKTGTDMALNFLISYNEKGMKLGDILNVAKAGHDYLWIRFQDSTAAGKLTRAPEAAYVEKVYRRDPWDVLSFLRDK